MTDSASDTFRSALNDTPSPAADAPATMPDVFADEAPVSFDDIPGEPEAAHEPKPEAPKQPEAPKPSEATVPSWRLREESEKRERLEAQYAADRQELADLKRWRAEQEAAKQPEPDLYEDPSRFVDSRFKQQLSPIEQRIQAIEQQANARFMALDFERAIDKYGEQDVKDALELVKTTPGAVEHFLANPTSPHKAMMEWARGQKVLREFGADPKAARQKILDEALSDPEYVARVMETTRQGARPVFERPQPPRAANGQFEQLPSLNRTAAASTGDEPDTPGDTYRQALRAPRGR